MMASHVCGRGDRPRGVVHSDLDQLPVVLRDLCAQADEEQGHGTAQRDEREALAALVAGVLQLAGGLLDRLAHLAAAQAARHRGGPDVHDALVGLREDIMKCNRSLEEAIKQSVAAVPRDSVEGSPEENGAPGSPCPSALGAPPPSPAQVTRGAILNLVQGCCCGPVEAAAVLVQGACPVVMTEPVYIQTVSVKVVETLPIAW